MEVRIQVGEGPIDERALRELLRSVREVRSKCQVNSITVSLDVDPVEDPEESPNPPDVTFSDLSTEEIWELLDRMEFPWWERVDNLQLLRKADNDYFDWRREVDVVPERGHRVLLGAADGLDLSLAVLGLEWPCTLEELKATHRRLSREYHPDRNGTGSRYVRVQQAERVVRKVLEETGRKRRKY